MLFPYFGQLEKGSNNIPALLATIIPTLSDAPVRLQGKALNHVFESPSEIIQSICEFYLKETLNQIYKIIGSLDFVGNPTMHVTSFMSDVRDLVRAPSTAFRQSPTDASRLGLGVAQGALSLFSHSISGFFGVLAKVSAASGQAVAVLSLDSDFRDWHRDKVVTEATNLNREWKRRGVQSSMLMLTRPVLDIILGVAGGVSGLVTAPIKGYHNSGSIGMFYGMVVGGVGVSLLRSQRSEFWTLLLISQRLSTTLQRALMFSIEDSNQRISCDYHAHLECIQFLSHSMLSLHGRHSS